MEQAVQMMMVIHCVVFGMSHALQPTAWAQFFIWLRGKGYPGVFGLSFLYLAVGSLIVSFHNVWTGIPAVLTVFGWAQVLKALLYFWVPSIGMRGLQRVTVERAWMFVFAGVVLLLLGGLLAYSLYSRVA